jgi:hypothetical protein
VSPRYSVAHVLAALTALVFLIGAISSAARGFFPLRAGNSIEKNKDPIGFWGAIAGLLSMAAIAIFWAFR